MLKKTILFGLFFMLFAACSLFEAPAAPQLSLSAPSPLLAGAGTSLHIRISNPGNTDW